MPPLLLALLVLAGPLAFALLAFVPAAVADRRPFAMARLTVAAAGLALAGACVAAAFVALAGPASIALPGWTFGGVAMSLGIRLDALSTVMLLLVAFVGLAVVVFSRNGLAGDDGHGRFMGMLAGTLACVLVLVVSGGLLVLMLAWVATSLMLHRLLVFYPGRARAVLSARKKFVVSRIGDACLLMAIVLTGLTFGTLDFDSLFPAAKALQSGGAVEPAVIAIAVFVALAALLKSAQVPVHGWLTEVIETPTPVSALLHAGIINAGGYLLLRMSDIVVLSGGAMHLIAAAGAVTALVGSIALLTQTSIKVSLAWSTVAQMGFMMIQCGLGTFTGALLHIVGHSLYKAHAFLGSGEVLAERRARLVEPAGQGASLPMVGSVAAVALALAAAAGFAAGGSAGVFVFTATLLLGLTPMLAGAAANRAHAGLALRLAGLAATAGLAYVVQLGLARLLVGTALPAAPASDAGAWILAGVVAMGFAALVAIQAAGPALLRRPAMRALYVHALNGFGMNALADRLLRPHGRPAKS